MGLEESVILFQTNATKCRWILRHRRVISRWVKKRGNYFAPLSKLMPMTIPTVPMTVFSLGGTFTGGGGQVDGRLGGGGYEEAATPAMESKERSRDTGEIEMKPWNAENPEISRIPLFCGEYTEDSCLQKKYSVFSQCLGVYFFSGHLINILVHFFLSIEFFLHLEKLVYRQCHWNKPNIFDPKIKPWVALNLAGGLSNFQGWREL